MVQMAARPLLSLVDPPLNSKRATFELSLLGEIVWEVAPRPRVPSGRAPKLGRPLVAGDEQFEEAARWGSVLANVGDNVVTATFWVVLNTISLDADIVGIIVVIPTFCGVGCVNADASVGASAATAVFGCVGCVKPSPIGGDTMATPTLGTVTSAILSVSLIVGARVVAATFDGVPKVIVSAVAIVGEIVTAATFGTGEVIPNALVIATTAAATFGGVTAVIAEAKVGGVVAAATFCGVGSRILSASPIVGASVETATF